MWVIVVGFVGQKIVQAVTKRNVLLNLRKNGQKQRPLERTYLYRVLKNYLKRVLGTRLAAHFVVPVQILSVQSFESYSILKRKFANGLDNLVTKAYQSYLNLPFVSASQVSNIIHDQYRDYCGQNKMGKPLGLGEGSLW